MAAAILENARGDVVGDKTFGDGSVQKIIDLPDGSALILSIAKYYSPSGKAIQDTAVTPNIVVADADDDAASPTMMRRHARLRPDQEARAQEQDEQLQQGSRRYLKSRKAKLTISLDLNRALRARDFVCCR